MGPQEHTLGPCYALDPVCADHDVRFMSAAIVKVQACTEVNTLGTTNSNATSGKMRLYFCGHDPRESIEKGSAAKEHS